MYIYQPLTNFVRRPYVQEKFEWFVTRSFCIPLIFNCILQKFQLNKTKILCPKKCCFANIFVQCVQNKKELFWGYNSINLKRFLN